jgi:hypothetical protein
MVNLQVVFFDDVGRVQPEPNLFDPIVDPGS